MREDFDGDEPLNPMRGCLIAGAVSAVLWLIIGLIYWGVYHAA